MVALKNMKIEPIRPPKVPLSETPPETPGSTGFKFVISRGFERNNVPISVAHVSNVAAETEAR